MLLFLVLLCFKLFLSLETLCQNNISLLDSVSLILEQNDFCLPNNSSFNISILNTIVSLSEVNSGEFGVTDIGEFAVYSTKLLSAYAAKSGLSFRMFRSSYVNYFGEYLEISDNESEFSINDVRWQKIKLLLFSIDPLFGWSKYSQNVMWIDSDAVITNFSFSINELLDTHSQSQFLMSADIRQGTMNSGSIIFRNTQFSYNFLSQWLQYGVSSNPLQLCDQDAFDALLNKYKQNYNKRSGNTVDSMNYYDYYLLTNGHFNSSEYILIKEYLKGNGSVDISGMIEGNNNINRLLDSAEFRLSRWDVLSSAPSSSMSGSVDRLFRYIRTILPMSAINSHPPAWKYYSISDPVLHLMGEESAVRTSVFKHMWERYCSDSDSLMLSKDDLYHHTVTVYDELLLINQNITASMLNEFFSKFESVKFVTDSELMAIGNGLSQLSTHSRIAHHVCDILHTQLESTDCVTNSNICDGVLHREILVRQNLFEMSELFVSLVEKMRESATVKDNIPLFRQVTTLLIQGLKRHCECGNDYYQIVNTFTDKNFVSAKVLRSLEILTDLIDLKSRIVPMHMKAMFIQSIGLFYMDCGRNQQCDFSFGLNQLLHSAELFDSMLVLDSKLNEFLYPSKIREYVENWLILLENISLFWFDYKRQVDMFARATVEGYLRNVLCLWIHLLISSTFMITNNEYIHRNWNECGEQNIIFEKHNKVSLEFVNIDESSVHLLKAVYHSFHVHFRKIILDSFPTNDVLVKCLEQIELLDVKMGSDIRMMIDVTVCHQGLSDEIYNDKFGDDDGDYWLRVRSARKYLNSD